MIVTRIALWLVIVCLPAAVMSGFGHRLQLWGYATGFKILTAAVIGAGVGAALALIGAVAAWRSGDPGGLYRAVAAVAIGLLVAVPPLWWARTARQLPYIHDITTDSDNPPVFVEILKERAQAPNSAEYGGPEIAKLQKQAYPEVQPLRLPVPPAAAFAAALETAHDLGWSIVAQDAAAGRIEASDRTFWYGFIDDVVIRVTAAGDGSRVDVRSVSRVGKSDIGTNARRIRKFLDSLAQGVS